MDIEKERAKAQQWGKLRARGKVYMVARSYLIGAIAGGILAFLFLPAPENTADYFKVIPTWSIPFGLVYAAIGYFSWNAREKHYRQYMGGAE
ncbi:MAG: hypothetical protein Q4G39_08330 [Brachymonas sp.]|nr:hypothetical protein [Brachymonas sp.]